MVNDRIENLFEKEISELTLLCIFGLVVIYMLLESNNFSYTASVFPRLVGYVTLTGIILLIIEPFLPGNLKAIVGESGSLFQRPDSKLESKDKNQGQKVDSRSDFLTPTQSTTLLIGMYVGLSYLISIILASVLFISVYLYWFEKSWKMILIMIGFAIVTSYGFYEFVNIPVDEGILIDSFM